MTVLKQAGQSAGVPLITPEELAQARDAAEEIQRAADEYAAWLRSPEGQAWVEREAEECRRVEAEIAAGKFDLSVEELAQLRRDAEELKAEIKSGEYDLTAAELAQLQQDGTLTRKWHAIKSGGGDFSE